MVTVLTLAYNHEPFIRKCLEGIVSQKTDFNYELIIHDDASTDGTALIIKEFQAKYPDIIKPIYQKENQYSRGVSIGSTFMYPRVKGRFVALCEGDDYWTDPFKLQKQVDYLESHPECSLCFTNAIIHWYNGSHPDSVFACFEENDFSGEELCRKWISPTASFVFRASLINEYISIREQYPEIIIGDSPLLLTCAKYGKIHGIPDITCVYGKHEHAWTQYTDALKTYQSARSWEAQRAAFGNEYDQVMTNTMTGQYLLSAYRAFKEKNVPILFKAIYRGILRQPIVGFRSLFILLTERVGSNTIVQNK